MLGNGSNVCGRPLFLSLSLYLASLRARDLLSLSPEQGSAAPRLVDVEIRTTQRITEGFLDYPVSQSSIGPQSGSTIGTSEVPTDKATDVRAISALQTPGG